jgi:acetate CoA/acetoacetate CoA-transferase alpha subunit
MSVHNSKVMAIGDAMSKIKDGARIMIGEFVGAGEPLCCIDWLLEQQIKDLTLITNTPGFAGGDFGKSELFGAGLVKELISTHVGTTPESSLAYLEDRMLVKQYFPMGTWAEKVRAGGHGLGGVLVPVGVGILDEEGLFPDLEEPKPKVSVNGQEFFIEEALTSDVSIIKGWRADELGNVEFRFTSRQNQRDIAMAGDFTIVEVNEIVPVGTIAPVDVGCPGPFVDAVVQGHSLEEQQDIYRKRWVKAGKLIPPAA